MSCKLVSQTIYRIISGLSSGGNADFDMYYRHSCGWRRYSGYTGSSCPFTAGAVQAVGTKQSQKRSTVQYSSIGLVFISQPTQVFSNYSGPCMRKVIELAMGQAWKEWYRLHEDYSDSKQLNNQWLRMSIKSQLSLTIVVCELWPKLRLYLSLQFNF